MSKPTLGGTWMSAADMVKVWRIGEGSAPEAASISRADRRGEGGCSCKKGVPQSQPSAQKAR